MEEIELLKKKNNRLRSDIIKNQNAIYASIGVILMIAFASLGGGVVLGLLLNKMIKTIVLSIGVTALLSVKSFSNISKYNRNIFDCNSQINANNREIKKIDALIAKEKKKQIENKNAESRKNNYPYKENKFSKKTNEFNNYLNSLKDEGFFDFNDDNTQEKEHRKK